MLLSDADHLLHFRAEADRCAALARTVPLDSPVPHLPGWSIGSVIRHLIGDFRWASAIIRSQQWDGSGFAADRRRSDALLHAYDDSVDELESALRFAVTSPSLPCPNFADRDAGVLGWWPRHQAAETLVHRWDVETAVGDHTPIEPYAAADAIDEALHVYTLRYGPHRLTAPIVLRCDDVDADWTITPIGGRDRRVDISRGAGNAATQVTATAEHLLLAVWRRTPIVTVARFDGDELAAADFFRGPLTA